MEFHPMKSNLVPGLVFLLLTGFACSQEKNSSLGVSQARSARGLANPAAVKCINDGYELKTIEENGVTIKSFCVNKETGMECEIWSYFRGECDLVP